VPRSARRAGRTADRDGAGWARWDIVAITLATVTTLAILVNVLFMQSGPQSAPIRGALKPTKPATTAVAEAAPRPRPTDPASAVAAPTAASTTAPTGGPTVAPSATAAPKPGARMPGEIINDVQRELARRGYYDGIIDGLYGPKTDSAIRDFEQSTGLKPSTEPNEALLAAIVRAQPKPPARTATMAPPVRPPLPVRNEVERPVQSKRVIALQRALADYGYGQIRPSGVVDGETQAAIEKFERERRLPVTGQPSDRVVRELSAMTGRPLE